jgi:tetratricopeptide (TPR) repeat protein
VSLSYLNKSLNIFSDNNDVLLNSGIAFNEIGLFEKSEECWGKVRAKNPTNPKLMSFDKYLAGKYLAFGVQATNSHKLDSALYYYNKSLEFSNYFDSARVSAYYNIGGVCFLKADYYGAHAALEKVMAIDSNYLNVRAGYEESGRMMVK